MCNPAFARGCRMTPWQSKLPQVLMQKSPDERPGEDCVVALFSYNTA